MRFFPTGSWNKITHHWPVFPFCALFHVEVMRVGKPTQPCKSFRWYSFECVPFQNDSLSQKQGNQKNSLVNCLVSKPSKLQSTGKFLWIQTKHHHPWTKQSDFTPKTPCFMVFLIDVLRLFWSPSWVFSTSTSLKDSDFTAKEWRFSEWRKQVGISWPRGGGWGFLIGGRGRKGGFKMLKVGDLHLEHIFWRLGRWCLLFHWMIFGFHHVPSVNFSWISILAGFVACRC